MSLDPKLLEILACPEDKGPLLYFEDEATLYNPRLKRRYRIDEGIPVMLIDEAETVDDNEADRLEAKAVADGVEPTFDVSGGSAAEGSVSEGSAAEGSVSGSSAAEGSADV